ncbi:MAG: AmmeMemoRadiSam system protein B, partial [Candidatus Ozemobacteraceae bacterium]
VHGRLLGLILPHAGFIFSGPVVTWGMKRLFAETPLPKRFLLLGPKHTPYGSPAAISPASAWRTPLGDVPLDEELRTALLETGAFDADAHAHAQEHSLEVQLPFLQASFERSQPSPAPFSIVPLALHFAPFEQCLKWGAAIATVLSNPKFSDVRVLVSSDFSHDTPRAEAYRIDSEAINIIEHLSAEEFYRLIIEEDRSICGVIPITTFLCAISHLKRKILGSRLTYSTSMDVMSHPRGVGYAAVVFEDISAIQPTSR